MRRRGRRRLQLLVGIRWFKGFAEVYIEENIQEKRFKGYCFGYIYGKTIGE